MSRVIGEGKAGEFISARDAELYEAFLARERPQRTAQGFTSLRNATRRVIVWFEREGIELERAGYQDALAFQTWALERGISVGAVTNELKAANNLFDFMVERGLVMANPFAEVPRLRVPQKLSRNALSETEMHALLSRLARFDEEPELKRRWRNYRVHVLAETAYATGARIAELASLRPADIDLARGTVLIRYGKGGKSRVAFLTDTARDVLAYYLERGRKASSHCFASATLFGAGFRQLSVVLRSTLRVMCRDLDISVITSHGFRHSLGWHLLRRGCDMRHIQAILGHERIGTTQVYTRVEKEELRSVLDACHPRSLSQRTAAAHAEDAVNTRTDVTHG